MINKLQKLLNDLMFENSKAESKYQELMTDHKFHRAENWEQRSLAFEFCIDKLEEILKEETAKDLNDDDCTCSGGYANPNCPLHYKR